MTPKEQVIASLQRLPDDCAMADIEYQIYVLTAIYYGLMSVERGEVVPHEEVKKRIEKWRKQMLLGLPTH